MEAGREVFEGGVGHVRGQGGRDGGWDYIRDRL